MKNDADDQAQTAPLPEPPSMAQLGAILDAVAACDRACNPFPPDQTSPPWDAVAVAADKAWKAATVAARKAVAAHCRLSFDGHPTMVAVRGDKAIVMLESNGPVHVVPREALVVVD